MGPARSCKGNFARYVKEIMPLVAVPRRVQRSKGASGLPAVVERVWWAQRRGSRRNSLDIDGLMRHKCYYRYVSGQTRRPQDGSAPTTRKSQSPSRPRRRSALRQLRLLRPARRGAGQVRDGAAGAGGGAARQPQCHRVRVLASVVLSGPGSPGAWRARRPGPQQAGAPAVAQARCRGDALPAAAAVRGRGRPLDGVGPSGSAAFWPHRPSAQRRARAGATGKKTAVTRPTTPPRVPRPRSLPTSSCAATRWRTHSAAEGSAGSCSCAKGWRAGSIGAPRAARRPSPRQPGTRWWRDRSSSRCTWGSSTCWPASRCRAERP